MWKFILSIMFVCPTAVLYAQGDSLKAKLYRAVELHDKGDYPAAIALFDEVIAADPDNLLAYYEKSFSLFAAKRFEECANLCREILKNFKEGNELDNVYVNYGSSLDALGKPEEAIKVYSEGIKKYNHYLLFFNRGITLYVQKRNQEAVNDFQEALRLNPLHASSHQYLGYAVYNKNKMASLMSLSVFLMIEPVSVRAKKNLKILNDQYDSLIQKNDRKSFTLTLDADMLDENKQHPDNFSMAELAMALRVSLDEDSLMKHQTLADRMEGRLKLLATAGDENGEGFFTNFYIPFFKTLKETDRLQTASNLMLAESADENVRKWLQENNPKIEAFFKWLKEYKWLSKDNK